MTSASHRRSWKGVSILIRLSLRNLLRHPWRAAATVFGVAIGIAAVLATLSVGANVQHNLQADLEAAAGEAALLIGPGVQGRAVIEVQDVLDTAAGVPGIRALQPVLNERAEPVRTAAEFQASLLPGVDTGFQLSGRDVSDPERLPSRLVAGRWPQPGEAEIAMTDTFARGRGLQVGDEVPFAMRFGSEPFRLVGLMDAAEGYASTNGARVAIVPLDVLQEKLRLGGRALFVEVLLQEGAHTETVRAALNDRFGEAYSVTYPAVSGALVGGVVQTLQTGLLVLSVALLVLGGFMAYNTFMAAVVERTRDYALLRTIALRSRDVRRLALAEAAWIGLAGAVMGVALGAGLAYLLTLFNAVTLGFEFRSVVLPAWAVAAAVAAGLLVSLTAGALPALEAGRASPLAARRAADTVSAPARAGLGVLALAVAVAATRVPWPAEAALLAAGLATASFVVGTALAARAILRPAVAAFRPLLVALFGVAGRLGADLARRNASRNGVAIGTVVVGTGLVIAVGGMVNGIDREVREWVGTTVVGDLFVTSPVRFPADFEESAATVAGVDQVSGVGLNIVRLEPEDGRARNVALVLVDPERFHPEDGFGRFRYLQGMGDDATGHRTLLAENGILIAAALHERLSLQPGDTVRMRTTDGFAPFTVGGVVVDFTGGGETVVASIRSLERFGGGSPDLFVMTLHDGADAGQVSAALRQAYPDLHLDLTPNDRYRERILALVSRSTRTTDALVALAVLIAALGVANTLGMNLTGRARELALLRTLGLTRGGLKRVVVAEGIVVVIVGTVLGVAFGLLLGDVVARGASSITGYAVPAVVPWGTVIAALAAAPAVGLLASLAPARRAARLSPMAALRGSE